MCLIIYRKNAEQKLDTDIIESAARQNQDGFGITYLDTLQTLRTMDYSRIPKLLEPERPFIAHFRYATRGTVGKSMCHPFRFERGWLYSNGTVDGLGDKNTCDTQVVADFLNRTPKRHWATLLAMTPTRFAIVEKSGKVQLYGTWVEYGGILYSKDPNIKSVYHYGYGTTSRSVMSNEDLWDHERGWSRKALPAKSSSSSSSSSSSGGFSSDKKYQVGVGYRQLLPEELIQPGDQFWNEQQNCWTDSHATNTKVNNMTKLVYRRKLPGAPADARPEPPGRLLVPGEMLREGDLVQFGDGQWYPTRRADTLLTEGCLAAGARWCRPSSPASQNEEAEIREKQDTEQLDAELDAWIKSSQDQEFLDTLALHGFTYQDFGCFQEDQEGALYCIDGSHFDISSTDAWNLPNEVIDFLTGQHDPILDRDYPDQGQDQEVPNPESWEGSELLAVYGTLKRGRGNHGLLDGCRLVGVGNTLEHLRMTIHGCPFVYSGDHELGHQIPVEVYRVLDPATRIRIDRLEGHPDWYRRTLSDILLHDGTVEQCWIYLQDGDDCPPQAQYAERY